jgi:hypothetical protein
MSFGAIISGLATNRQIRTKFNQHKRVTRDLSRRVLCQRKLLEGDRLDELPPRRRAKAPNWQITSGRDVTRPKHRRASPEFHSSLTVAWRTPT